MWWQILFWVTAIFVVGSVGIIFYAFILACKMIKNITKNED